MPRGLGHNTLISGLNTKLFEIIKRGPIKMGYEVVIFKHYCLIIFSLNQPFKS